MDRRRLIGAMAGSLIAASLGVKAQQVAQARRIGWLWNVAPLTPADLQEHTRDLRALGWVAGQNLVIEWRYASGNDSLLPALAEELVRLKVEIIVAEGTIVALAAKSVTSATPIVVARSGDPVRAGLVASLARPGANVTGTSTIAPDLDLKRIQLLHELLPTAQRVGELFVVANPLSSATRAEYERAYNALGMQPIFVEVANAGDLESAVAETVRRRSQVLHVSPEPLLAVHFDEIVRAARKYSLPIVADNSGFLDSGALVSYGPDNDELNRQTASIIDKILRGARPADLPIQQPRKFELGINLKVAKAFGITVPPALLLRADKVIQ
jgi:putative tryptophan/tyrosine transport system substrate-binding protein